MIHPITGVKKDPGIIIIRNTTDDTHDATVITYLETGYGSSLGERPVRNSVATTAVEAKYCFDREYPMIVASSLELNSYLSSGAQYYPYIQIFMPLGANAHSEVLSPTSIPFIVTCGAGSTQNDNSYGNGLEFWDVAGAVSWANGIIAGKLLYIKEQRNCTWWEARYAARQTASNGGTWDINNGYGKIDTAAAIAWSGTVPADPYL